MRNFFSGAFKDNKNLSYGFPYGNSANCIGKHFQRIKQSEDKFAELADEALAQIDNMRYDAEMKEGGIKDILKC